MSENTQNKNTDEIDLLDLFRRMGNSLSRLGTAIWRAFLISVVFLVRRWLPLGLSIVIGVGLSFYLKYSSASFYTSDLVIRNNAIPTSDMIEYINRLHTFCVDNNEKALSGSLSLKPEAAKNILDIGAFWIIDKGKDGIPDEVDYENSHNIYDTLNVRMNDRIDIRVTVQSPEELTNLQNQIINFIKHDSLFQQKNRVRLRQNSDLLTRINYDITELDSLQKIIYFQETKNRAPLSSGQMIFLQEQKKQLIYPEIYNLYSRKQALEVDRDLYKEIVSVLSNFDLPSKRQNGGLYYAKKFVPLLFGLTLLLLIVISNWKKLTEVYKKY